MQVRVETESSSKCFAQEQPIVQRAGTMEDDETATVAKARRTTQADTTTATRERTPDILETELELASYTVTVSAR